MAGAGLPTSTCNFIDKMSRNFIWKGNSNSSIHLVGWDNITLPRKLGGLGIRKTRKANTAMLGNLVWDVHTDSDKLWVQISRHKYVKQESFLDIIKKLGFVIWNSIMKAKYACSQGWI